MNKTIAALKRVEVWVESLTGLHPEVSQEQREVLAAIREALAEQALGEYHGKLMREVCNKVIIETLAEPVKQEPVAVVEITYGREPECYVTGNIDDFPEGVFKLYAAPVDVKAIRAEVLEEAAKVCDERGFDPYTEQQCAAAIRSLK